MAVKFSSVTLHGKERFLPDIPLAFEDPDAEPYFIACGWAEKTTEEPKYTYSQDEVSVDLDTIHSDSRAPVGLLIKYKGDAEKARSEFATINAEKAEKAAKGELDVQDVEVSAPVEEA